MEPLKRTSVICEYALAGDCSNKSCTFNTFVNDYPNSGYCSHMKKSVNIGPASPMAENDPNYIFKNKK
jgi:hypothetical protein